MTMRIATFMLALGLGALMACGLREEPSPRPPPPPPPKPKPQPPNTGAKYQRDLIMMELVRTHPVIAATLDKNMDQLNAALKKGGKVNELRRDMRLGPPLREACRLGWKEGINVLREHGAQCLGDSQCESCIRDQPKPTGYTTTP